MNNETVYLTPRVVATYREILADPPLFKLNFKPMKDTFESTDKITANHILFKQYIDYIQKPLPKLIFYILMIELYGKCPGVDESGAMGYPLKINTDTL